MPKITYEEYRRMLLDTDSSDEEIAEYSIVVPGESAFDPQLKPDPTRVEMTQDEIDAEDAMRIGNAFFRWRRNQKVKKRLAAGDTRPLLVAEGDSWFQFPLLIQEIVDQLGSDYLVWCVSAAGDTAQNMVLGPVGYGRTEYMTELRRHKGRVKGFLFSAAGNDIIGEDPTSTDRTPVLMKLLKRPAGEPNETTDYIDLSLLGERLNFLRQAYRKVINDIHSEPGLQELPIFVHGYDVPFPHPWEGDKRDPSWAEKDQWLGRAFARHQINEPELRRKILRVLINALYDMYDSLLRDPGVPHVHVVDCRDAMPSVSDWADEIHGNNGGFARVAARFKQAIQAVI